MGRRSSHSIDYYAAIRRAISSQVSVRGRTLLDVGTGSGQETEFWAAAGSIVIAVDRKLPNVLETRERLVRAGYRDRIRSCVADIHNLPFARDSVDCVYAQSVLMYTKKRTSMDEIARVLRSNGHCVLVENTNRNPIVALGRVFSRFHSGVEYVTDEDVRSLARLLNCTQILRQRFYLLVPMARWLQFVPRSQWLARLLVPVFAGIDTRLLRACPNLQRYAWVCAYLLDSSSAINGSISPEA